MRFFRGSFSRRSNSSGASDVNDTKSSDRPAHQRNLKNLTRADVEDALPSEIGPAVDTPPSALESKILNPKLKVSPKRGSRKAVPQSASETISVVLRRQVPIRFDEEVRSWLGGLPRLPAGMAWPLAKPKKPLHFLAQINCADLPPELWNGLGPREGWLLLFADLEALTEQLRRPCAQVIHVTELGQQVEPPPGLYWVRNNLVDVSNLKGALPDAQRRHFRKWPVDLIETSADTSQLTGSKLYDAPENDRVLFESDGFPISRPLTWRGAYTVLAGLVLKHNASGYEVNWRGNSGGLVDYPEPDASDFNRVWQEKRERIAAQLPGGYSSPEFTAADAQLKAQMYEERRQGWTKRAFKVLEEEGLARGLARIDSYRAKLAEAQALGDTNAIDMAEQSIVSAEEEVAKHRSNRVYLEKLFAQYPSEDAFVAEINRVGLAHLEWAQYTQDLLLDLLDKAGKMDLDTPIAPADWDDIAATIATMKTVYWQRTYDTDLLRKVERGVNYRLSDVTREEILDRYADSASSADHLAPEIIADLEPRLRHFEADHPHKLGGMVDSVYGDPLNKDHILLFQIASDAATGWIMGDLGLLYVSIRASDLAAGAFDNVKAWIEA